MLIFWLVSINIINTGFLLIKLM